MINTIKKINIDKNINEVKSGNANQTARLANNYNSTHNNIIEELSINEIKTVHFDTKRAELKNNKVLAKNSVFSDRVVRDQKFNVDSLQTIVDKEKYRDGNGRKTDEYIYNNTDEVIEDLKKLEKKYSKFDGFKYYNQNLYEEAYGDSTIQTSGCCPTCFAMIASYLKNEEILPTTVVEDVFDDYYCNGTDVTTGVLEEAANYNGFTANNLYPYDGDQVMDLLRDGKPIILNVDGNLFTSTGHYIVLLGVDEDDNVVIADPNSVYNSTQSYSIDTIMEQTKPTGSSVWWFEKSDD